MKIITAVLLLHISTACFAQPSESPEAFLALDESNQNAFNNIIESIEFDKIKTRKYIERINFSAPGNAGFDILGLSTDNVITPNSSKELSFGLLNGLDRSGNFQTGFTAQSTPFFWFADDEVNLTDEAQGFFDQLLNGMSISFTAANGQSAEDTSERYGIGLDFYMDWKDPAFDKKKCYPLLQKNDDALDALRTNFANTLSVMSAAETNTFNESQYIEDYIVNTCVPNINTRNEVAESWNKTETAAGITVYTTNTSLGSLLNNIPGGLTNGITTNSTSNIQVDNSNSNDGFGAWFSQSFILARKMQLIIHARYNEDVIAPVNTDNIDMNSMVGLNETMPIGSDTPMLAAMDGWQVGTRIRYGNNKVRFLAELGFEDANMLGESDNFFKYSAGLEFRLTEGIYAQLLYGDTSGDGMMNTGKSLNSQLKWNFSESSIFD